MPTPISSEQKLLEFLLYLGSALTAAGEAVNLIQERLLRVATAYGAPNARISVFPTFLVVSLEPGRPATQEPTKLLRGGLRLDQTARLYVILDAAEHGRVDPHDGSRQILDLVAAPPRLAPAVRVTGHAVLTVGICLILLPTWTDLLLAGIFGLMVGVFKLAGARWASAQMIMPVVASFTVAALTFLVADAGWITADLRAMVAPLTTFLPGAMLTMAVVELSAYEMVTGSSRLVAGILQLLLLAFGIIGAAQAVGVPTPGAGPDLPPSALGSWGQWIGPLIVGLGLYLMLAGPPRAFGWVCLVLYAGWIGQYLGNVVFGAYLSGFTGALVLTVVAYLVEHRPSGPPALVSFLPGFWLLVPGALTLIGVTEYLGRDSVRGAEDLTAAVGSMLAVALGVLCGHPLYRGLARALGKARRGRSPVRGEV